MIERIQWLGHASFRIQGLPFIYIDPWRISRNAFHADVVLVSHDHYDHCSLPDVEKLRGPDTIVLANSMAAALLPDTTILRPWQVININSASIRAIPAYNSHHPKDFGGLGFVISMEHTDIYFAGDTGLIDEMSTIRADIAVLPIGGRQTMNVENAVEAVKRIRPRYVIPSHWGTSLEGGTEMDARLFAELVTRDKLAEVVIPTRS